MNNCNNEKIAHFTIVLGLPAPTYLEGCVIDMIMAYFVEIGGKESMLALSQIQRSTFE